MNVNPARPAEIENANPVRGLYKFPRLNALFVLFNVSVANSTLRIIANHTTKKTPPDVSGGV